MTRSTKRTTTAGLAFRAILFVAAIAAVGYLGMSTSTLSEIWQVFHDGEPVATQPAE